MTIYFIRAMATDFVKVGFTERESSAYRLSQLQIGCPHQLSVEAEIDPGPRGLEFAIHHALESRRERGEWFRLTPAEVDFTVRWCGAGAMSKAEWDALETRLAKDAIPVPPLQPEIVSAGPHPRTPEERPARSVVTPIDSRARHEAWAAKPETAPRWLPVGAAAAIASVSRRTIDRWIAAGVLRAHRPCGGARVLVDRDALLRAIDPDPEEEILPRRRSAWRGR